MCASNHLPRLGVGFSFRVAHFAERGVEVSDVVERFREKPRYILYIQASVTPST